MAAATLQRVMHRKTEAGRTFNVAVVGLSGTERDKGAVGVGKSCLCNRFVRAAADHYYTEHISVLSQTDFSGRVVNNEHFMYWGEATKVSEEGIPFQFSVVEQTEFIDDASFQPFKGPNHRVIVRFVRSGQGSVRDAVMARRLELRGKDLYINESLTRLRGLIFRSLLAAKREKKIYTVYSRGGQVYFKEQQFGVGTRVDSLQRLTDLGYTVIER
ncbi:Rho GTPase-activating protein 190 [Amphibalanus amphitrite]|uniref:Rho GTPase-activating protein 190 n=1 Tax=Amphibalanus amphitrite TaxID=1232801 RepID=A0A6A4WNQ5_AMPAM|nr:Rho GTPase-activating protein 190 [Amphibalanus amphitrite]